MRYGIDCLLVMALPDGAGLFWAGKKGTSTFFRHAGGGVRAARGARRRRAARARAARRSAGAPGAPRGGRADAAADRRRPRRARRLSPTVRGRAIGAAARRGDDSDPVGRSGRTARVYALDGIPRESVAEVFSHQLRRRSSTSTSSSRCTTTCSPTRPSATGRRRRPGMRSSLRLPLRFDGRVGGALEFSSSAVATYRETDVDVGAADRRLRDAGDRAPADGGRGRAAPRRCASAPTTCRCSTISSRPCRACSTCARSSIGSR